MSARPRHLLLVALVAIGACAPLSARAQAVDPDDVPSKNTRPAAPPRAPAPAPVPQLDDGETAPREGPILFIPPNPHYLPQGWSERDLPSIDQPAPPPRRKKGVSPDDPSYTPRRYKLLAAGAVTLGGAYLATLTFGSFIGKEPLWAVPFVGPVMVTQKTGGSSLTGLAIVVVGAQATGVVLTAVGLAIALRREAPAPPRRYSWNVAPVLSPDMAGASVWGRF